MIWVSIGSRKPGRGPATNTLKNQGEQVTKWGGQREAVEEEQWKKQGADS